MTPHAEAEYRIIDGADNQVRTRSVELTALKHTTQQQMMMGFAVKIEKGERSAATQHHQRLWALRVCASNAGESRGRRARTAAAA